MSSKAPSTTEVQKGPNATASGSTIKPKLAALTSFVGSYRKQGKDKAQFPPAGWHADALAVEDAASLPHPQPADPDPSSALGPSPILPPPAAENASETDSVTLAQRIRATMAEMTHMLPVPSSLSRPTSPRTETPPPTSASHDTPAATNANGPPEPPPVPTLSDRALAALLASPAVMNGSMAKGRESVWAMLDRLRAPSSKRNAGQTATDGEREATAGKGKTREDVDAVAAGKEQHERPSNDYDDDDDDDNSTVMFYAPLTPEPNSQLELAPEETVEVDANGKIIRVVHVNDHSANAASDQPVPSPGDVRGGQAKGWGSAFSGWSIGKKGASEAGVQEVKIWVPSTEKISLEARWWGYRLYLPPPVLEVLSSKQLEAGKRAAMLTTALQWLVRKIPTTLVPLPYRPAVNIIKRLVPYLGYLGGIIAWSWGTIKGFDKGNGVILSATWLMPIALIPSTWEVDEVPRAPDDASNPPLAPMPTKDDPSACAAASQAGAAAPAPAATEEVKTPPAIPSSPSLPGSLFRRFSRRN